MHNAAHTHAPTKQIAIAKAKTSASLSVQVSLETI